ncbi:MAG TPA: metalloregulator ArsR/SmtB family transcription factor [Acidimicrobiales bacterium]|nr:metalloregulator ArsR/SmtB family transcription factor [Acidimicrobiales bacterium]
MTRQPLDPVFSALADGTRRDVIEALAAGGSATATELAKRFPVTRQAIAKHLHALADAGLVDVERAGREARWHLTPAPFDDAMRWLAQVGGQWDARLAALERHLEQRRSVRGIGPRPAGSPASPGLRVAAARRDPPAQS